MEYITARENIKALSRWDIFHIHSKQTNILYVFNIPVKPKVTSLIVRRNASIINGSSPTDAADINVGEELELTCTANIGNLPETIIRWNRTSETDDETNDFIDYQPTPGTFDEGTASTDNCGYTREATIKYNTTAADANKDNSLAFECYVRVSGDPYGFYTSENNPRFYANVSKLFLLFRSWIVAWI